MSIAQEGDYWLTSQEVFMTKIGENETLAMVLKCEAIEAIIQNGNEFENIPCPEPHKAEILVWLNGQNLEKGIARLKTLGLAEDADGNFSIDPKDTGDKFIGDGIFVATCKHEEYKGNTQVRWDFPYEGGRKEVSDQEQMSFMSEFSN